MVAVGGGVEDMEFVYQSGFQSTLNVSKNAIKKKLPLNLTEIDFRCRFVNGKNKGCLSAI